MKRFRHCALATLTTFSVAVALRARHGPEVDPGESGGRGVVVVARVPIPVGAKITAEQLATAPIPNGSMPEGAFQQIEKVVGRVAVIPIGVREPVTIVKLAPEGTLGGLSAVIPEGYRVMTVKVGGVVGLSGFVMPGSFVDVVCVITPPSERGGGDPISKIILQNIKVLASGDNIDRLKDERDANSVKAVTLQVTPEQAEKLALAASEGKLQLIIRNDIDRDDAQTPPPAPQRNSVEVLTGVKRRNVEFP